jgi:hypothetical protein
METPGKVRLGRLGPQSFFGELAIMSAQTAGDGGGGAGMGCSLRTRSVVSRAPCHFHVLTKHDVDELRAELPPLEHVSGADPSFVYIAVHFVWDLPMCRTCLVCHETTDMGTPAQVMRQAERGGVSRVRRERAASAAAAAAAPSGAPADASEPSAMASVQAQVRKPFNFARRF